MNFCNKIDKSLHSVLRTIMKRLFIQIKMASAPDLEIQTTVSTRSREIGEWPKTINIVR